MEEFLLALVDSVEGAAAYGLIFGILLICGLGVPIPEDISLTLGGFLAHQGRATLWGMMVTGYLGIIVGDSIIYFVGRKLGANVGTKPRKGFWGRLITPEKRRKVERIFEKYGDKVVMVARFMPGLRAITYFIAGSVRLKYWRFVLYDSIAALASAPIFVFLGWYFGGELETLFRGIKEGKMWAVVLLAAAVVLWLGFWFGRKRLRRRRQSAKLAKANETNEVNDVQRKEDAERL
jgi:membrane protein DedA with SNARE-associated domain